MKCTIAIIMYMVTKFTAVMRRTLDYFYSPNGDAIIS